MNTSGPIRVMVVDDDGFVRGNLAWFIEQDAAFCPVVTCANGEEAVRAAAEHEVDVVLMDVHMPVLDGLEATRRLVADHPDIRVLMWTSVATEELVRAALAAGSLGFLLKTATMPEVLDGLRAARRGLLVLGPEPGRALAPARKPASATGAPPKLSPRERQILACLCDGMSNAEIGRELHISASTVKLHIANLMQKFAADSRLRLVVRALDAGLP